MTKRCIKCHTHKALTEFYPHSAMRDGYLNKCKPCCLEYARLERILLQDRVRAREKRRNSKPKRRADARIRSRAAYARNPSYKAAFTKSYRSAFPERYRAHNAVNNAVRDGRLRKQPCAVCGEARVEAHHYDYSRPLDVEWLCKIHHAAVHFPDRKGL